MFDYELSRTRDKGRALKRLDLHPSAEVEVISPAFPHARSGILSHAIGYRGYDGWREEVVPVEQLENLSPPQPVEPEVRWVAVDKEARQLDRGHACSDAFPHRTLDGYTGQRELHPLYMGCLDPATLWEKWGVHIGMRDDRKGWFVNHRVLYDLDSDGEFTGDVRKSKAFPTYAAALLAATNAAKKLSPA